MTNLELARWYAALLGGLLVLLGLAGFVDNPLVGQPAVEPVFHTGDAQNLLHVGAGAVALFVGFGLSGIGLVRGLIGFGLAFGLLFALCVASPRLFGLFDVPVNLAGHVLHAGLAVVSVSVGWLARAGQPRELSTG